MDQVPLQRHFSDSMAFAPRHPSRLGPGRGSQLRPADLAMDQHVRGTVSMPTSSLMGEKHSFKWEDQPQSAQPFYTSPGPEHESDPAPAWYSDNGQGVGQNYSDHYDPPSSADVTMSNGEYQQEERKDGQRKKRAQVRIACTHCQKACKKCSNTRPCERCVRYGLTDCVDSQRKPRKTGVKRGPYKRRSSAKYHQGFGSSGSPSSLAPSQLSPQYMEYGPSSATQASFFSHLPQGYVNHGQQMPNHLPPGPRTSAIHGAFASALSRPRWVNGQRLHANGQQDEHGVLYPPTPVVPFPISLNNRSTDPFSRAVSPIHGDLEMALHGLAPQAQPYESHFQDEPLGSASRISFTDPFSGQPIDNGLEVTLQHPHPMSAPTSPRSSTDWPQEPRSASIGPGSGYNEHTSRPHPFHGNDSLQSPAVIALQKIRKPSMRTLLSHGGSLANSRQSSPVPESPTLFDQAMAIDDEGMGRVGEEASQNAMWFQDQGAQNDPRSMGLLEFVQNFA